MATHVVVKKEWMNACGFKVTQNTKLEVLDEIPVRKNGMGRFFRVKRPVDYGQQGWTEWTVCEDRLVEIVE
jgi:hypothetical protein